MDLDEFKEKWADYDRKLDESLRLNRQLLNAPTLNRAQSAMTRLAFFLAVEAIIQFLAILLLGNFLYQHLGIVRFAIPGAALHLFAIAIFITLVRQMTMALQIDYARPMATIQKQLTALRVLRIRYTLWILLAGPLAWVPLLIVMFKGIFGLDVYQLFGAPWLMANLLFGLGFMATAIWLSKKYSDRMGRSPFIQRLMKELAGYNLNAATDFLASISEFEDEKPER